jgi:hypothetical protein
MNLVCIDDEYFDPYHILGVTPEDDDSHIYKAFKIKAKKYHPDKAKTKQDISKYNYRFRIVLECYDFIKNKRAQHTTSPPQTSTMTSEYSDPTHFGYGEQTRYNTIDDYDAVNVNIVPQFDKKNFKLDKFNRAFSYNQTQFSNLESQNTLVHKTSDGFYGYNSGNNHCATVNCFNGLLITGDDYGQKGIGYWGDNYSDYKLSFHSAKNPVKKLIIPETFNVIDNVIDNTNRTKFTTYTDVAHTNKNYKQEASALFKTQLDNLVYEENANKDFFMKYGTKQYDKHTIQNAINGRLQKSKTLIDSLHDFHNIKRIN